MEITVISAEGLINNTSKPLFSHRLRPFATVTAPPCSSRTAAAGDKPNPVYRTRVDDEGGKNPNWGDKFVLPIDANFLYQSQCSIFVELYTKLLTGGHSQLGWCQIPAFDILDGLTPPGSVRHLSYRLRARDGSKGHGVVNLAVKLEASVSARNSREMGLGQTVMGFPAAVVAAAAAGGGENGQLDVRCKEGNKKATGQPMQRFGS
ncbi:BON1-associated protein 1-like [Diospyros lotus]|uniref:BON1-associated protein 1-like n=1 Tax=Diospyros lotus TaxID=55363 RepID=UPI00224D0D2A|nr:BON1-associated protein 1-like [Diospyros lotus]